MATEELTQDRADPDAYVHTLADLSDNHGEPFFMKEWRKSEIGFMPSFQLADAEACLYGAAGVAALLRTNAYSSTVGPECSGIFEVLDDDLKLQMHVALEQLIKTAMCQLENTRLQFVEKSERALAKT